jgi:hypothetical protein
MPPFDAVPVVDPGEPGRGANIELRVVKGFGRVRAIVETSASRVSMASAHAPVLSCINEYPAVPLAVSAMVTPWHACDRSGFAMHHGRPERLPPCV